MKKSILTTAAMVTVVALVLMSPVTSSRTTSRKFRTTWGARRIPLTGFGRLAKAPSKDYSI